MSGEMRKLQTKWQSERGWPQRLEWLEITGLRGWTGQRISLNFPVIAIAGENGAGKSTILQAIASIYRSPTEDEPTRFPTQYFPDTPWDKIRNAAIAYQVREGETSRLGSIQKPTDRWRETPARRKRAVRFIDLRRIQAISSRVGYLRIAKNLNTETKRKMFSPEALQRFSAIQGRTYDNAGFALSNVDENRWVPITSMRSAEYSGFHQGAGELALAELLQTDFPKYGIVLIDEFETSLHPRAQRRLMRELAEICRVQEIQLILTTHSPYVLEELPPQGRMYVMNSTKEKVLVTGVSPSFALTQMDDEPHPELDIYVEDSTAQILLEEIIVATKKEIIRRCAIIPYGAASVGLALGQMVKERRFPRPSLVFLDADQEEAVGCLLLPGDDAPERVLFSALKAINWKSVPERIGRAPSEVIDSLESSMTKSDHHEWVSSAADRLIVGGNELWRALCSSWVSHCADTEQLKQLAEIIQSAVDGIPIAAIPKFIPAPIMSGERPVSAPASTAEPAANVPEPAPAPVPAVPASRETQKGLFSDGAN
jgi:predicted ATPase